jgi:nucleotide-binding universal stress UspA family protein
MSATEEQPGTTTAALGRVLCVTDDSPAGAEAVRQAAALAGAGAGLDIVSVAPSRPPGAPRPQAHQIEALVTARLIARDLGVRPDTHIVEAADEASGMLERCSGHDVIVVPAGPSALEALERAPIPVLIARPLPAGAGFADSVLVAVDGSPAAHEAARIGARLAAHFGAPVALVATPEHDAAHRHALQDDVAAVTAITGATPLVLDEERAPGPAILGAAASAGATLIVLGSRPGTPAGSVSAAVARDAACPVLVLRPGLPLTPPRG